VEGSGTAGPTQCGITALNSRCTKGGCKRDGGQRLPGAGLSCRRSRKAPLGKPTFQPYWGKPAVRNEWEDRGIVGIIRSPVRASILPDPELTLEPLLAGQLLKKLMQNSPEQTPLVWQPFKSM
jgi:hypothetical protein